ncbi:MAG: hypothetical protein HYU31_16565, partial [Deltaproteobacteria bacterium]|nr:hypothetical protein [Deltaproteobacteria bacterium]
ANHSWGGYHWARTSNSFTLKLGNNVRNDDPLSRWYGYLGTTSTDWSVSSVLDITIVGGGATSDQRKCRPTSGRVEVCSYKYGTNGWLGVATIWINGKHITQGTVKMNDSYFDNSRYPKYNSAPWRNMVMCQEIGHTLGLDHQDETFKNLNLGTCMDYTNYPEGDVHDNFDYGPANVEPNPHDYDQLLDTYDHPDTTTTVKQSLNSRPGAANNEPERLGTGQWGKLVRSTNHGRTELYELDLGRGRKVLTRVIWADPED